MKYKLVVEPQAEADIDATLEWMRERSRDGAARWHEHLGKAIGSLSEHPARCRLAPDSPAFEVEIHQLLFWRNRHAFQIVFFIDESTHSVHVLHVRRCAMNLFGSEEEEEPSQRELERRLLERLDSPPSKLTEEGWGEIRRDVERGVQERERGEQGEEDDA